MFDGMADQFYQFLAAASRANTSTSTTTTSLPLPLSFSLHHHHHHHHPNSNFLTSCFDVDGHQQVSLLSPPPHLLLHHNPQLPLHHNHKHHKQETSVDDVNVVRPELEPIDHDHHPWSNDEVLALLRIRSSMDNNTWFPDFTTWDNVSRKLAEVGFKRSAEKCKEKFEEETRSFNSSFISNTTNNNKNNNNVSNITNNNYRLFGELEEVYTDHHQQSPPHSPPPQPEHEPVPEPDPVLEEEEVQELQEDKGEEEERLEDKRNDKEEMMRSEDSEKTEENTKRVQRKRKRSSQNKFEMFKGFCESIVNKMMAQQEKLHCKILEDMVKRDEEKIAKEEAWKKQEIERLHKEMEVRAHEQAIAGDRQAKILEFLNKFMNSNYLEVQSLGEAIENLIKVPNSLSNSSILTTCTPTTQYDLQNPSCSSLVVTQKCSSSSPYNENLATQSPSRLDNSKSTLPVSSPSTDQPRSQNPTNPLSSNSAAGNDDTLFKLLSVSGSDIHTSTDAADPINMEFKSPDSSTQSANHRASVENSLSISGSGRVAAAGGGGGKDDIGRRWPRDEVLALINIRCNLFNKNGDPQHDKLEGSTKGPLWERISQKMMELGYKRSAKRCKEKWENINKYFRKTKDLNKKRSIDSRTCPYFHQLSNLYSQTTSSGVQGGGSTPSNDGTTTTTTTIMHNIASDQGNEGVVQAPSFDFDF